MPDDGEECVLGQVTGPVATEAKQAVTPAYELAGHESSTSPSSRKPNVGESNATPPMPLAEERGEGG